MGNEIAFRLSGGIFFNLILAARKKPLANQNECLRELLYIFDRSVKGIVREQSWNQLRQGSETVIRSFTVIT